MKKLMHVLLMLALVCSEVYSQTAKEIEKQYKELIKNIKKENNLKSVEVKIESDGFWYFLLTGKDKTLGVANIDGQVIIPVENIKIDYFTAEPSGQNLFPIKNILGDPENYLYYYTESEPVFHVQYGTFDGFNKKTFQNEPQHYHKFINVEGKVYIENLKYAMKIPGYWIISNSNEIERSTILGEVEYSGSGKTGLLKTDGTVLLPPTNQSIFLGNLYKEGNNDNDAIFKQCKYKNIINGVILKGGINLIEKSDSVKCLFNDIKLCGTNNNFYWKVKKSKESNFERYDYGIAYTNKYKDEGEKLYEEGKYEAVIEFYSIHGIKQPWAKFFTGASLYFLGYEHYSHAQTFIQCIKQNDIVSFDFLKKHLSFDLNIGKKQLISAIGILEEYIKEDTTFTKQAEQYIRFSQNNVNTTEKIKQDVDNAFEIYTKTKEKQKSDELKRQREIALRTQQQRTEVILGILNIFANSLLNEASPSSTSVGNGNVNTGYAIPSGNSSTKSNGNNSAKIADWENRRADAIRRLKQYEEQLSKDPNSSYYKQMVSDMRNLINQCDNQLQFLRSH